MKVKGTAMMTPQTTLLWRWTYKEHMRGYQVFQFVGMEWEDESPLPPPNNAHYPRISKLGWETR